jgi:low affinity Fe/Cu permease
MRDAFDRLARWAIRATGSYWAFSLAMMAILIWIAVGPFVGYSDSWQLVINTATTIVTFLVVFLIQAAQNIESKAVHIKLNEIISALDRAQNTVLDVEQLSSEQLASLGEHYQKLAQKNRDKD